MGTYIVKRTVFVFNLAKLYLKVKFIREKQQFTERFEFLSALFRRTRNRHTLHGIKPELAQQQATERAHLPELASV